MAAFHGTSDAHGVSARKRPETEEFPPNYVLAAMHTVEFFEARSPFDGGYGGIPININLQ